MKKLTDINSAKEYVRDRADLREIIAEDIGDDREWGQEGTDTMVTLSPFRNESKPSFKVSDKKFKDWGGEQHGGDVYYSDWYFIDGSAVSPVDILILVVIL